MNIGKMMKNLQKMQTQLASEVENIEIEASSGGEMVKVRMNGKKELVSLKIAAEAITPDDPELMEDLVIAAVNEGGRKVDEETQRVTEGLAGGMNIPGLT